jgi:hypothetical protein
MGSNMRFIMLSLLGILVAGGFIVTCIEVVSLLLGLPIP